MQVSIDEGIGTAGRDGAAGRHDAVNDASQHRRGHRHGGAAGRDGAAGRHDAVNDASQHRRGHRHGWKRRCHR